jgi:hypothetical protein
MGTDQTRMNASSVAKRRPDQSPGQDDASNASGDAALGTRTQTHDSHNVAALRRMPDARRPRMNSAFIRGNPCPSVASPFLIREHLSFGEPVAEPEHRWG